MQNISADTSPTPAAESAASGSTPRPSQQAHSTPTKSRIVSSTYRHESVDGDFRRELEQFQFSGISFEDFLINAFDITKEELKQLLEEVEGYGILSSPAYKEQEAKFAEASSKLERAMYDPYTAMGNMVLDRAMESSKNLLPNKVKLLKFDTPLRGFFAERKPDILLVPECDDKEEITIKTLKWENIIWALEFKKKHQASLNEANRQKVADENEVNVQKAADGNGVNGQRVADGNEVNGQKMVDKKEVKRQRGDENEESTSIKKKKISTRSKTVIVRKNSPGVGNSVTVPSTIDFTSGISESTVPARRPVASSSRAGIVPPLPDDPFIQNATSNEMPVGQASFPQFSPSTATAEDGTNALISRSGAALGFVPSSNISVSSTTSTTSRRTPPPEIQLANYIAEVMSARGDRTHAFGALVERTEIRLQFYSHSCGVVSDAIDIIKNPALHAAFLVLITRQTMAKLGFNTVLGYCNPFNTADNIANDSAQKRTMCLGQKLEPIKGGGDNFELDSEHEIEYEDRVHVEYGTVGRGTTVLGVKRPPECKVDLILKASWQVKTRRNETEAIFIAQEVDRMHSPEIYGELVVPDPSPTQALVAACRLQPSRSIEVRELRILLMRRYQPVSNLSDADFLDVMSQIMFFTHELYSKKSLLHRDIGIFNIVYFEIELGNGDTRVIGVLIDYDLATFPIVISVDQQSSNHRSGTKPFMAVETLDAEGGGPYTHHYIHEVESILYTSVWQGVGYRGAKPPKSGDHLFEWRKGTWAQVRKSKKEFIDEPGTQLNRIHDIALRQFCSDLCSVFSDRYAEITKYYKWARVTHTPRVVFKFSSPNFARPTLPEPPIPSKAIFPIILGLLEVGPKECSSDCCHPIIQVPVTA